MSQTLIIIDPIFRGSRLYFTRLAVKAAEALGMTCSIISRTDAKTEHFEDLFRGTTPTVFEIARVEKEFWYGKIPILEQKRLIDKASAIAGDNVDHTIYLPGLNELWPDIAPILTGSKLSQSPTLAIEYHPEYMLRASISMFASSLKGKWRQWQRYHSYRQRQLDVLSPWLRGNSKTQVFALDERILDSQFRRIPAELEKRIGYLSDPAPIRIANLKPILNTARSMNLLLVGSQSSRKGLSNIIRLCNEYPVRVLGVQFTLVGKLTEDTEHLRSQLIKHKSLISWNDSYVSEQKIAQEFENADYVVLPYSREFSGSSGVLGSAVAHRKPVIASDHGLVGHRVSSYGLGATYPSQNTEQLWKLLNTLPHPKTDKIYEGWVENITQYAPLISEQNHIDQLVKTLQSPL